MNYRPEEHKRLIKLGTCDIFTDVGSAIPDKYIKITFRYWKYSTETLPISGNTIQLELSKAFVCELDTLL
jgi:hypothetical protein